MKHFYILPVLAVLSACASGSIFGDGKTEKNAQEKPAVSVAEKTPRPDYVPYRQGRGQAAVSKRIYTILASRAVNKMLKNTAANYAGGKHPSLYVAAPVAEGQDAVPANIEYAGVVTRNIIAGSHGYALAGERTGADYVLETFVRSRPVAGRGTNVIVYTVVLKDGRQNTIGSWTETLSPVMNDDKSWW